MKITKEKRLIDQNCVKIGITNSNMIKKTELCKLAEKYGTDKCPAIKHPYTPFYYELFKDKRDSVKKVMELGIGWYPGIQEKGSKKDMALNRVYHKGASLLMWRDFFPKAQVYGIDIRKSSMLSAERIETFNADSEKEYDWERVLKKTGTDIDIFVDDGYHHPTSQAQVVNFLLPKFSKDVVYIIEDVSYPNYLIRRLNPEFSYEIPELKGKVKKDGLMIVKLK